MARWITTTEAARRLGVRRETLYAYVSRGVLVSRRQPGQQESLFDRTQVESLAAAKGAGRSAGERLLRFRGVATRVSAIADGRLSYRGVDVEDVVARASFAEAARLVLGADDGGGAGAPADGLADAVVPSAPAIDARRILRLPLERRIPLAVAEVAATTAPDAEPARVAGHALALLSAIDSLLPELPLEHPWVDALSTCLIDNGLAASTTAARVAASARAGIHDALLSGLGALAGPLHGAAGRAAHALLARVAAGADAAEATPELGTPGFGHVVYEHDDPRATIVLDLMRRDRPDAAALAAVDAVRAVAARPVNVDLAIAALALELDLPAATSEALFQRSRIVGMAAHVAEEYGEAPLRWRARADG